MLKDIDWGRLAKPQTDAYDSHIVLALAESRGYRRSVYPSGTYWDDSKIVLQLPENIPVSSTHDYFTQGKKLLSLYPEMWQQVQILVEAVKIWEHPQQINQSRSNGFGQIVTTLNVNRELDLVTNIAKEIAKQKLWAMGIGWETPPKLVINSSEAKYYSFLDTEKRHSLAKILQDLYAYTYRVALELAIWQETENKAIADSLSLYLPQLEFSYLTLKTQGKFDEAGTQFIQSLFTWLEKILAQGEDLLKKLNIIPKPYIHPLLVQLYQSYPQKNPNLQENQMGEEILIYSTVQEKGFLLNKSAAAVWQMCNGERSLEEIIQCVADRLAISPCYLKEDISLTVQELWDLGILSVS